MSAPTPAETNRQAARSRPPGLSTALVALSVGATAFVGGHAASVPRGATAVAVVFPPWWPAARIFAAAGSAGEIVRTGSLSSVLVVHSTAPGLAARLESAGALFLFDPVRLAPCGQAPIKGTSA